MNKGCNTCRWQTGEKGECFKYEDCFNCPMCSTGGTCKCLAVTSNSECPYWEPMNNVEIDGHKRCYSLSIAKTLNGECPYYEPRKESGDEDNTEM